MQLIGNEEIQERMEHFTEACRVAGARLTHQRLEIFREIACSEEHPDAETIYRDVRRRIPSISLDTVYRNLWLLVDLGLVKTLGHTREHIRFDANIKPHHHFVCSRCGLTRDFDCEEFDLLTLPEEAKKFGSVKATHVEVKGLCSRCLQIMKGKKSGGGNS